MKSTPKPTKSSVKAKPVTKVAALAAIGLDEICRKIAAGESSAAIAASVGMSRGHFAEWMAADAERSARVREAMAQSARHWDDEAVRVLVDADATVPGDVAKARELASHYRWRAKCYAPKIYGDQLKLDADVKISLSAEQIDEKLTYLMGKMKA